MFVRYYVISEPTSKASSMSEAAYVSHPIASADAARWWASEVAAKDPNRRFFVTEAFEIVEGVVDITPLKPF